MTPIPALGSLEGGESLQMSQVLCALHKKLAPRQSEAMLRWIVTSQTGSFLSTDYADFRRLKSTTMD